MNPLSHKFNPCLSHYVTPTAFQDYATSRLRTATIDTQAELPYSADLYNITLEEG